MPPRSPLERDLDYFEHLPGPDYDPKTLGDYRDLCVMLAGENSRAVKFFDDRIAVQGCDEPVVADKTQMMYLIASLLKKEE
jgi:hypothetical protein